MGEGGWQAHAWDAEGDAVENCEVLCMACYMATHREA
jgi:hypothetical protein